MAAGSVSCPQCGAENPKNNRFCDTCGAKMVKPDEAAVPAKAAKPAAAKAQAKAELPGEALLARAGMVLDSNMAWMLLILAIGIFLRLYDLGAKPLHHDESIHSWYAFKLFKGESYKYDPAYHGPFRYHFTALMFFIFGVSDYTTRLLPAIFGICTLVFLWEWRRFLGEKGALFGMAMIAVSPSWTYVSRFIRDDINMVLGEMLIVWGLFRHFETRAAKYLYWATLGLMLAFTSHEGTWIFLGIMVSFLGIRALWEHSEKVDEDHADVLGLLKRYTPPFKAPGADIAGGVAAFVALAFGMGTQAWSTPGVILSGMFIAFLMTAVVARLLFFGTRESQVAWRWALAIFGLPFTLLFTTFFTNMDGWVMGAFDSIAYWLGEQSTGRADQPWQFYIYMLSLYELGICSFALLGGLRLYFSSGKAQLFFLKIFAFVPFFLAILILQAYPKSPPMVLVMSVFAVAGAGMAAWSSFEAKEGNHFKVFLLYWSMLALVMFTIAGERMPWLTLHPLTPLTFLAALYLDDFFSREEPNFAEHYLALGLLALPASMLAFLLPRQLLQALVHFPKEFMSWLEAFGHGGRHGTFQNSTWGDNGWLVAPVGGPNGTSILVWGGLLLFAIVLVLMYFILERWPQLKRLTRGTFIGLFVLALMSLSHGTMNLLFHGDGADPREQLVYVQSSIELVELTHKLDRMSRALTGGPYLKIGVEDLCSWPMSWYLRDMPNAQIGFGPPLVQSQVADFPVVITGYDNSSVPNHDQTVADSFSNSYNAYPVRFRRWWGPDLAAFKEGSLSDQAGRAWNLFMYREPWMPINANYNPQFDNYVYPKHDSIKSPYGSFDACVWVRKDVDKYFQ
jgi:uncharacterized protein (TIGR03663 family)